MSVDIEHRTSDDQSRAGEEGFVEDYTQYRALSVAAVASCALGALSVITFLSWAFAIIPLLGVVLGVLALVRIRRNQAELVGSRVAQSGIALSLLFCAAGVSYLTYDYLTEVPDGYRRLSYSRLQPDEEQPGQLFPPEIEGWNGERVFIKGYVYPTKNERGIKEFILCRDNGDCCFGGQPKLTDRILVDLKGHLTYKYSTRMIRLAGTFRVEPGKGVDGVGGVIYHLDADYLK
ncbi:MAG TPA: DUF4190 domain-containing protein [Pirellulales bacterium]|jgi:hypothetical protein